MSEALGPNSPRSRSSAADFLAPTSATPASEPESTASTPASGPSTLGSFAFYDHASSSWKTWQRSLFGGWSAYSETWPRAGTMRSGTVSQRRPSAPLTGATGSSFSRGMYPTPAATEAGSNQNGICADKPSAGTPTLHTWARHRQTPRSTDGEKGGPNQTMAGKPALTAQACRMWPTPNATDYKGASTRTAGKERPLCDDDLPTRVSRWGTPTAAMKRRSEAFAVGRSPSPMEWRGHPDQTTCSHGGECRRSLGPRFVAWLMGFPATWCEVGATRSKRTVTPSSRRSPK